MFDSAGPINWTFSISTGQVDPPKNEMIKSHGSTDAVFLSVWTGVIVTVINRNLTVFKLSDSS